jgi:hypothetical protein
VSQQLLHIRLESDTYDRVKAEADRQDISMAEFIRRSVEKALSPAQAKAPRETAAPVDPVIQTMANGIRREAASRGLSPEMIVQLWFQMMRPILPGAKNPDPLADGLKLNLKISDEPEESK